MHTDIDIYDIILETFTCHQVDNILSNNIELVYFLLLLFLFYNLQAIEKDRLALISPDIQSSSRPTNQLTYRLDVLQKELNKKSEEANYFQTNFYGIKENLETKNDENKELRGKVLSLEENNLNLEQELSSYRTLHLNYDNKENKMKDKKGIKGYNEVEIIKDENKEKEKEKDIEVKKNDEKKIQVTRSKLISKTKYEDKNKNIVSPEN